MVAAQHEARRDQQKGAVLPPTVRLEEFAAGTTTIAMKQSGLEPPQQTAWSWGAVFQREVNHAAATPEARVARTTRLVEGSVTTDELKDAYAKLKADPNQRASQKTLLRLRPRCHKCVNR
jgi:hypothetical protein